MRRIGEVPREFQSRNTCQHRGRVFHFYLNEGKLVVTEVILGDEVERVEVQTAVECKTTSDIHIACCPFGARILVMAGREENVFAALIEMDGGRLSKEAIHITLLAVSGDRQWLCQPYLCQVEENRALLYFDDWGRMWHCDIAGNALNMRKIGTRMPTSGGFCTLPIRLPNGKLLVAGVYPQSTDITLISCDEEPQFERIRNIPGVVRESPSSILVGDRFVVGFGESWASNLWIFDLQTRRGSIVWEKGEWAPRAVWPALVLRSDTLHIISRKVYAITLRSL